MCKEIDRLIFITPPGINCFVNDIHITAQNVIIVSGRIKGAAPAFNRTLERVALKQASRNPQLQATFKQAALYTQLKNCVHVNAVANS